MRALHFFLAELVMLVVWAEKVMWGFQVISRLVGIFSIGKGPPFIVRWG